MSRIVNDLTYIFRCCNHFRNRQLEALGLSVRPASLLLEICATPGISQDALASRGFLNKSVVARALSSLEEDGFVERSTCQKDKRINRLYPTEKTLQLLPQLQQIQADCEDFLTADLSQEEVDQLETLLSRLQLRATKWMEVD